MSARKFYEANATNMVDVPRPGHPEDPSGWAGVRRASEARFIAKDALVMTLPDAYDFAEKYCRQESQAAQERAARRIAEEIQDRGRTFTTISPDYDRVLAILQDEEGGGK